MNTKTACRYLLFYILSLLLTLGCSKKDDYEHTSSSMKPEGRSINSPTQKHDREQQEDYAVGDLESLDATGSNLLAQETTSAEYQATYGRSTAPLYPVFFDFDSSTITADQLKNLNSSAFHLLKNSSPKLIIEGNCDERGTADYNLALGELRAINVKKYLVNLGVVGSRITTVSFGEQRPLYHGSDKTSLAGNRRADLVLP